MLGYTHLGPTDRQKVVDLELTQVTLLNDVSCDKTPLAETCNVEISVVEVWVRLDGFAVVLSLFIQSFDKGVGLCVIASNIDALTVSSFNVFLDEIDEVFDLLRSMPASK